MWGGWPSGGVRLDHPAHHLVFFFHLALEALDLIDVLLPALALREALLHLGELRQGGERREVRGRREVRTGEESWWW